MGKLKNQDLCYTNNLLIPITASSDLSMFFNFSFLWLLSVTTLNPLVPLIASSIGFFVKNV
jgi:hypothetical protein